MKKLTDKQEKFAQLVVKLGNQSEAYRQAYDVKETTTTESVNVQASALMSDLNISLRVEELREQTKKAHDIDRDRMVKYNLRLVEAWEELWELGKKENKTKEEIQRFYLCKDLVKGSDYKSCLAEISKLTGLYQPEKREVKDTSHSTEWG
jgi:CRISPR/Cas system-associated endoribonuclease Cas2